MLIGNFTAMTAKAAGYPVLIQLFVKEGFFQIHFGVHEETITVADAFNKSTESLGLRLFPMEL
jgi:hypothetical protein